jgi:hypothetical protein
MTKIELAPKKWPGGTWVRAGQGNLTFQHREASAAALPMERPGNGRARCKRKEMHILRRRHGGVAPKRPSRYAATAAATASATSTLSRSGPTATGGPAPAAKRSATFATRRERRPAFRSGKRS